MLIMEAHSFRHTTKSTHAGPADVHFWCHWLFSCNFNTLWLNINKTKGIDRTYLQFPLWFPVARVYTDNGAPYNNVKIWTHKPFWVPSVMSNLPPTHINLNWGKFDFGIPTGTVLMRHRQSLVCVWKNRVKVSKNKKVRYTCPTDFRLWRHHTPPTPMPFVSKLDCNGISQFLSSPAIQCAVVFMCMSNMSIEFQKLRKSDTTPARPCWDPTVTEDLPLVLLAAWVLEGKSWTYSSPVFRRAIASVCMTNERFSVW